MSAIDKITNLAVVAALVAGGYLVYRWWTGTTTPNDQTCEHLTGLPKTLCELGGWFLGNPNAEQPASCPTNATRNSLGQCICDAGFHAAADGLSCVPNTPTSPPTCPEHAWLNPASNACECTGGYSPNAAGTACLPNVTGCQAFDQWKQMHPEKCWEPGFYGPDGCPTGWHEIACPTSAVVVPQGTPSASSSTGTVTLNDGTQITVPVGPISGEIPHAILQSLEQPYAGLPCFEDAMRNPPAPAGNYTNCNWMNDHPPGYYEWRHYYNDNDVFPWATTGRWDLIRLGG